MTRQVLPTTLPGGGWSPFVTEYWESRPQVFRSIVPTPSSLSRTLFQAAVAAVRADAQARKTRWRFVSSRRLGQGSPRPLPTSADRSFERYLIRAAAETRSRDVSFILNGSQSGSAALFDSIINFLSGLYALVGTPLDCDATLFATRSRFSAFGIHRDPVSNFLFLAEGEKTFYLWPRNAVPGEPEVVPGAEIPALWESAEKIHLRAGDMLYMPTGYYHCGLQDGFSVHISIVVPTVDQRVTQTFLWRELEPFLRNCFDGSAGKSFVMKPKEMLLTKVPESITLPLRQGLDRARAAEQTIREALLRTQSASGFPAVPPERPYAPLKSSDWIVARRSNLHVMPVGAEFLVAACGQMYRCPAHPLLLQLLETLMTGEPVQVRQLLRRFTGPAQIEGQEVSLDAQWIRLFLRSLGQASWLKLVPSKGRAHGRSRTRVRSSRP